jgi:hypothetical protein
MTDENKPESNNASSVLVLILALATFAALGYAYYEQQAYMQLQARNTSDAAEFAARSNASAGNPASMGELSPAAGGVSSSPANGNPMSLPGTPPASLPGNVTGGAPVSAPMNPVGSVPGNGVAVPAPMDGVGMTAPAVAAPGIAAPAAAVAPGAVVPASPDAAQNGNPAPAGSSTSSGTGTGTGATAPTDPSTTR